MAEERLEKTRRGIKKSFSMVSVRTKTASKEMANGIANGISNGISKTRSLRNLRSGQLQRLENVPDDPVEQSVEPEKEKTVVTQITNGDTAVVADGQKQSASNSEVLLSKLPTLSGKTGPQPDSGFQIFVFRSENPIHQQCLGSALCKGI